MKKTLLVLAFFIGSSLSHAQQLQTTGGCEYSGSITGFTPNTVDYPFHSVLANGVTYTANVDLGSDMEICSGDIFITLDRDTLATVLNTPGAEGGIPLAPIHTNEGKHLLQLVFTGTWVNKGYMESDSITVTGTTAVAQIKEDDGIAIYPTPSSTTVNINLAKAKENIEQIRLLDMNGREMEIQNPVNSNSIISIAVSDFPAGMYMLQLQTRSGVVNKRIVVAH